MYFLVLALVGAWLIAEGALAIFYVYPPAFWVVVRVIRILLGGAILLEARRIRLKHSIDEKETEEYRRSKNNYIDLLTIVGMWTVLEGIGTGLLGWVYPIVTWQLIRLVRIVMGAALIFGGRYFTSKLQLT